MAVETLAQLDLGLALFVQSMKQHPTQGRKISEVAHRAFELIAVLVIAPELVFYRQPTAQFGPFAEDFLQLEVSVVPQYFLLRNLEFVA